MAQNFDEFPLDDRIMDMNGQFSNVWRGSISTFYQSLIGYLTQFGVFVPKVTTAERDSIQTPDNGQLIYNTTTNKFQGYENGAWANLI